MAFWTHYKGHFSPWTTSSGKIKELAEAGGVAQGSRLPSTHEALGFMAKIKIKRNLPELRVVTSGVFNLEVRVGICQVSLGT